MVARECAIPLHEKDLGPKIGHDQGARKQDGPDRAGIGVEDRDGNIMTGDPDAIIREGEGGPFPPPKPVVVSDGATDAAVRDDKGSLGLPATVVELNSVQQKSGQIIADQIEKANRDLANIDPETATGLPKVFNSTVNWLVSTARDMNVFGSGSGWAGPTFLSQLKPPP